MDGKLLPGQEGGPSRFPTWSQRASVGLKGLQIFAAGVVVEGCRVLIPLVPKETLPQVKTN